MRPDRCAPASRVQRWCILPIRWQTAVAHCQLKNLLAPSAATGDVRMLVRCELSAVTCAALPCCMLGAADRAHLHASAAAAAAATCPSAFLAHAQLLGDSVDARLAQQLCQLHDQQLQYVKAGLTGRVEGLAARAAGRGRAAGTPAPDDDCCKDRDVLYFCRPGPGGTGRPGSVGVGMYHLPGVHLSGPFHAGARARIQYALCARHAWHACMPPPAVCLVSLQMARMHARAEIIMPVCFPALFGPALSPCRRKGQLSHARPRSTQGLQRHVWRAAQPGDAAQQLLVCARACVCICSCRVRMAAIMCLPNA